MNQSLLQQLAQDTGLDEDLVEFVIDRFIFHLEQRLPALFPELIVKLLEGDDLNHQMLGLTADVQEDWLGEGFR